MTAVWITIAVLTVGTSLSKAVGPLDARLRAASERALA